MDRHRHLHPLQLRDASLCPLADRDRLFLRHAHGDLRRLHPRPAAHIAGRRSALRPLRTATRIVAGACGRNHRLPAVRERAIGRGAADRALSVRHGGWSGRLGRDGVDCRSRRAGTPASGIASRFGFHGARRGPWSVAGGQPRPRSLRAGHTDLRRRACDSRQRLAHRVCPAIPEGDSPCRWQMEAETAEFPGPTAGTLPSESPYSGRGSPPRRLCCRSALRCSPA